MANSTLFRTLMGKLLPATDACNAERAPAYAFTPKHALAQYAATGCLHATFYASAQEQLSQVLTLCQELEPAFIARTALYSRQRGFMKDVPALLCAILTTRDHALLERIFPQVIDNARMLRTFVQIMRSGVVGRKSFGTAVKRLIQRWLDARDDASLFMDAVGEQPSLADIVKMVHPKPQTASRAALYSYLLNRAYDATALPPLVQQYEAYKAGDRQQVPAVPFQMLTALDLDATAWTAIARRASWQMTRMNLNTFARHGVFAQRGLPRLIAKRLRDATAIAKARVFPYQIMAACHTLVADVPQVVVEALQDAMDMAIRQVPRVSGTIYVCPDVSGSMSSPVTGYRPGASSTVRCIDVAALMAASVLRQNPQAAVLPFEEHVVPLRLDARDGVLANAAKLAAVGGGGTNCSAPLAWLNRRKARGDLVIFVSDNESWVDAGCGRGTATMAEWQVFRQRNPQARLVCIDLQPLPTTQAQEREDILNIGGFSDQVFEVISDFAAGRLHADHWVGVIEAVPLEAHCN